MKNAKVCDLGLPLHRWGIFVIFVVLIGLTVGCNEGRHHAPENAALRLSSTSELNQLLTVGTSTGAVMVALGKAHTVEVLSKGTEMWIYRVTPFPADGDMADTYIEELLVYFRNGSLVNHGYTYIEHRVVTQPYKPVVGSQIAGAQSVAGSRLVAMDGISCDNGSIRLAWRSVTLLNETFAGGTGAWQIENYENALRFDKKEEGGTPYLSIHREGDKCDTAFCLSSPVVKVIPGAHFELRITARGPAAFARARGHGDNYMMEIAWLDANGKPAGSSFPFGLTCNEGGWQETHVAGSVPGNAVQAVIRIGADTPDVPPGHPLDLGRVSFSTQTRDENVLTGEAVSRPMRFAGPKARVAWSAVLPAGTRLALQVAWAPDDQGTPGTWSPFVGPDGSEASVFERGGERLPPIRSATPWLRYRVRLSSDSPKYSPILSKVSIGGTGDDAWQGLDQTPPTLDMLSPQLTSDAQGPVVFRVSDSVGIKTATLRFWVDGKEETAALQRKDGAFVFRPQTPWVSTKQGRDPKDVPPNLHRIRLSVEDEASNRLEENWPLLIDARKSQERVTLRNDGAVLIDRKPFFPIGIYAVWKKEFNSNSFDRAFAELKANGFNVAHTYNSARTDEFRNFLDSASRHGVRLFLASGEGANCMDMQAVLEDVARERAHPAVLAWYLADDTAMYSTPGELAALTKAVHAIDPDHITVQADAVGKAPRSNYSGFVGATDGFLPEIYPIRGGGGVPQVITDMQTLREDIRAAGNPVKTVWPIIQYFEGWGWPRFPTADELKAMSYLALIHGANGITWYTYGGHGTNYGATHTDATWRTLCGVSREISSLQEVLLSKTCPEPAITVIGEPQKDSQGHPAISVLAKQFQGKRYLLCANSAEAEVKAAFALPGVKRVTDHQDPGRKLDFAKGRLDVTFPSYGVRVFIAQE